MSKYTEDSIQKLDPLSFTRLRPDTYLGSNEDSTQLVREIITNCYDEFLAGNCTKINVWYNQDDNSITILDNGQGILPNVQKEDGRTILEMVYGDINTSGKYDKSDSAVYKTSTGAFGIGASLTCFLSHWLKATTCRDGQYETVEFIEGKFHSRKTGKTDKDKHGVEVSFQPSEEFFRNAKPNLEALRKEFFNMSCVCAGLEIYFEDKRYYHPLGLKSLLEEKVRDEITLFDIPFTFTETKDRQYLDFVMTSTSSSKSTFDCFCNYSIVEAGTPITAVKSCITRIFNKWAKDNGLLKKDNLSGSDIQEGMIVIFNLASPNIRYDSQTKVRVTSTEDNAFISEVLGEKLELWLDNNPEDAKIIIEKALLARKAAEAAKKAREKVKAGTKAANKKVKIMNPDKLKDAEHLGQDSVLLLVEGLSAGSTIAVARDPQKYGILMLRGKLINALTNDEKRFYNNEEVQLLLKALNVIPGEYNAAKLRYGRIGICVDSDSDGYNIGLLIMTALYKICPEFIQEKRLCWLRSPLYIVKNGKSEQYFFTDQEMNAARGKIKGEVQRNKGLGSLSAAQAKDSMFGECQHLDVLEPSYNALLLLEDLMGNSVEKRKEFIFDNIDFREVRE
jgi:DNA gyrase subunit B